MAVGTNTKFPALPLFPTTNLGTIIDIISKVLSEMLYLPIGKYFETILHWWLMWVLRSFTAVLTAIEPLPCMHTLPKIRSGWSRFKPFWNGCISKTVRPRALKLKNTRAETRRGLVPKIWFGAVRFLIRPLVFEMAILWDGDIWIELKASYRKHFEMAGFVRWRHLDRIKSLL